MSSTHDSPGCEKLELVGGYALGALPTADANALEAHIVDCQICRDELASLRSVVESLSGDWPTNVLRPSPSLRARLVDRIAEEPGGASLAPKRWVEPDWEEVAPGIWTKLLATDPERDRVSMLVRLGPGVEYPAHAHAGVEELHLLDGELWIDDRLLHPGDYNRAEPDTYDTRVWSETGCTCVLITSPSDRLG